VKVDRLRTDEDFVALGGRVAWLDPELYLQELAHRRGPSRGRRPASPSHRRFLVPAGRSVRPASASGGGSVAQPDESSATTRSANFPNVTSKFAPRASNRPIQNVSSDFASRIFTTACTIVYPVAVAFLRFAASAFSARGVGTLSRAASSEASVAWHKLRNSAYSCCACRALDASLFSGPGRPPFLLNSSMASS